MLVTRKSVIFVSLLLIVVVVVYAPVFLPNSPLKADTSYTVFIESNIGACTATFFQNDDMKTYCTVGWSGATINLNEGFYDVKIYYFDSGRFKEEFEIFVCKNITITIR